MIEKILKYSIIFSVILLLPLICFLCFRSCGSETDERIGTVVKLGEYYRDNGEEKKPLNWIITEVDDDYVYLLTDNIIDCVPFLKPPYSEETCWTESYIRQWLNEDFYNTAFSDKEKSVIASKELVILNYSRYEGGREEERTTDKVFLMTAKQAKELYEIQAIATDYAVQRGVLISPDTQVGIWWLMSPGYYPQAAACVDIYGNLQNADISTARLDTTTALSEDYCGVRPMVAIEHDLFAECFNFIDASHIIGYYEFKTNNTD